MNTAYLNPDILSQQFYHPAVEILGPCLIGFIFEQPYHLEGFYILVLQVLMGQSIRIHSQKHAKEDYLDLWGLLGSGRVNHLRIINHRKARAHHPGLLSFLLRGLRWRIDMNE